MYKKILALSMLINCCFAASAQLSYGVRGGYTSSNVTNVRESGANRYSQKSGLQFGLIATSPVSKNLQLITGLLYTQKGFVQTTGDPGNLGYTSFDHRVNYLELPIDLIWKTRVSSHTNFFIGTGLVPAIGISDKLKYSIEFSGREPDRGTTEFGFGNNNYYQRFDLGWNFLGGLEYKKIVLTADYNMALINLTHDGFWQPELKNRTFCISLGYYFKK